MKLVDGWYFPDGESHLPTWIANPKVRMILNGRAAYQGQKQVATMELCRNFRTAVDIGGHVGLWSFNLAAKFEHVHAFEPVADHRACFERNVLDVHDGVTKAANVTLHACALGDREDMISIITAPTSSGDSRVNGPGDIPMHTLDSMGITDVDLVKVDAEGFELFILMGAVETLKRDLPVIVVEQKPGHAVKYGLGDRDAIPFLESLGYRVAREMSGDFLCVPQ
jgi:FkbM family methyltransferase